MQMVDMLSQVDVGTILHSFDMNAWTVDSFLSNLGSSFKRWAGLIMTVLGVVSIIVAVWFAFKVATDKQQRGKWLIDLIIALIVAGALLFGGYSLFSSISSGISTSAKQMGR